MSCSPTSHTEAKRIAGEAYQRHRRPTHNTAAQGLYDSAQPWPDAALITGNCPRCHSTLAIGGGK